MNRHTTVHFLIIISAFRILNTNDDCDHLKRQTSLKLSSFDKMSIFIYRADLLRKTQTS